MAWSFGVEKFFDWKLLLLNCIIGFTGSILFAGMLAWIRCRSIVGRKNIDSAANPIVESHRNHKASRDS